MHPSSRQSTRWLLAGLGVTALAGSGLLAGPGDTPGAEASGLPYVYTDWVHYTTREGLPNDHIFSVAAASTEVWVGTEDGLAVIDKQTGKVKRTWKMEDGLPWKVVSGIAVNEKTGEVWLALFGGGLARYSAGRFDHWHQLNSGLVNDVVYGVALEGDNVWCATTAGASRYNTVTGEWTIFNEKNAPMEEIWNYGVSYNDGKVYLGVWGSGVLEYDVARGTWKDYLDPDGEMEIDLYRDDGIVHVITTGTSYVDGILWVSTYFGGNRYDGRHWRGYYQQETGLPSDFINAVKGRSGNEAWFCTDKGVGVVTDFPSDTWVTYSMDPESHQGIAVVSRNKQVLETLRTPSGIPHNYTLCADVDGPDVWVGTSKGLARGVGRDYFAGLRPAEQQPENPQETETGNSTQKPVHSERR
jgi:ligand-binding sensor domain-containing protein